MGFLRTLVSASGFILGGARLLWAPLDRPSNVPHASISLRFSAGMELENDVE